MNAIQNIAGLQLSSNCNRIRKASHSRPHNHTATVKGRHTMLSNQYLAHYLAQQEKDSQNVYQPTQYLTSPESCPPSTYGSSPSQWNVSPDLSWSEYTSPSFVRDCSDNTLSPTYCLPPCAAGMQQQPYDCATNYAADPLAAGFYQNAQMNGAVVTSPYPFNPLMFSESDSTCTTATSTPESIPPQQQQQQQHGFGITTKNELPGLMDEDEEELIGIGLYDDPEVLAREQEEAYASARLMESYYPMHLHHPYQPKERKLMKLEEEFDPLTAPAQKTRRHSTKSNSNSKFVENKENVPPVAAQQVARPASGPLPQPLPASTFYNQYAQQAAGPSYMLDSVSGFNGYPNSHEQQQQGWSRSNVSSNNMMLMMPPHPASAATIPSNAALPMEGLSFAPVFV